MKATVSPSACLTATLFAFASTSFSEAQTTHSLVNSAAVGASNNPNSFPPFWPGGSDHSGTGAPVFASAGESFTGLDSNGEEATMTFFGEATASVTYGKLHVAASGSVSGVYYNQDNAPYYFYDDFGDDDDETGTWTIDSNGSPTFLVSYGQSQFSDTLNYGNVPAGFTTDFWFNISGSFTGTNVYHSINVEFGTQADSIVLYPVNGANHMWTTNKFAPPSGVDVGIKTTTLSSFTLYPQYSSEGASYLGSADFTNTVTLVGINVYDENGDLVSDWTLSSASGTTYPVPEPTAALLGLVGVCGLLVRRRYSAE